MRDAFRFVMTVAVPLALLVTASACSTYDSAAVLRQAAASGIANVKFHGPAKFAVTATNAPQTTLQPGALMLSETSVVLLSQDGPNDTFVQRVVLRYDEIRGVALWSFGRTRQIQLFTPNTLIAVEVVTPSRQFTDPTEADRAYAQICARGIKQVEPVPRVSGPTPVVIPLIL